MDLSESRPPGDLPVDLVYPSSKDLEVISWQYPNIFTDDGKTFYQLPVAEVDIDNDGQKEIVVQTDFNGDGRMPFSYRVFRAGEFDMSRVTTRSELAWGQGDRGNYPSFVGEGLWSRIFSYQGTTYLLRYGADATDRSLPQVINQRMVVTRYYGGGRVFYGHQTKLKEEDLCVFHMKRMVEK